jgi:hypothetical protein
MKRCWLVLTFAFASALPAQVTDSLPFSAGERLSYTARTAKFGTVGTAVMAVAGPVDVRGTPALLASFDVHIHWAFMSGDDNSKSWIDPRLMASLRFGKNERRTLAKSVEETVEIHPDLRRWAGSKGDSGTTVSSLPLDELSFIYFLRTVTLLPDSTYSFDRHYDERRTPTTVRVVKHDTLTTRAGVFHTVELEMHVKDAAHYGETGVLHIWISDDKCRLPVRIDSKMSLLGIGTITLDSAVTPRCTGGDSLTPAWSNRR